MFTKALGADKLWQFMSDLGLKIPDLSSLRGSTKMDTTYRPNWVLVEANTSYRLNRVPIEVDIVYRLNQVPTEAEIRYRPNRVPTEADNGYHANRVSAEVDINRKESTRVELEGAS